ncbi:Phosphatidylinositol N-acetylglucosaminyltransferase subunit GPI1 [Yarrowia sp. B02]|nr:Phosphatidylinositol N-acetylglucosaminyltransferase subunit GPI1 [Yarrowia sp. B02]
MDPSLHDKTHPDTLDNAMRVFWPLEELHVMRGRRYADCLVVGWKNDGRNVVVIATCVELSEDAKKRGLEVIGYVGKKPAGKGERLRDYTDLIPFTCTANSPLSCTLPDVTIITYKMPNPQRMQFYSTDPISLGILGWSVPMRVISQEFEQDLVNAQQKKQCLMDKLVQHGGVEFEGNDEKEVVVEIEKIDERGDCQLGVLTEEIDSATRMNGSTQSSECHLETILAQINSAFQLQKLVHNNKESHVISTILGYIINPFIPLFTNIVIYFVMSIRLFCEACLMLIEFRVFGKNLKQTSATAIQLDLRLQQLCYLPVQWMRIRGHDSHTQSPSHIAIERRINESGNGSAAKRHVPPEYIRMYNTVWLVLNDLILGFALSAYLLDNQTYIAENGPRLARFILVTFPEQTIIWLMDSPAGLKLNTELAKFFGQFLLWVINFWSRTVVHGLIIPLIPYMPAAGSVISRVGGITLTISVLCDLISFTTLHIYAFYIASAKIFHWQLGVITSLFHLFRGKRQNVLRHRIDSCNYDLDQLLMGTIFFTVLVFLLPTVMVFYGAFALARLSIIILSAVLETILAFLNHFPLFALLLRAKDRKRLPGGIKFVANGVTLELQNIPLGFSKIFYQYSLLSDRIRFHYLSVRVIKRLLTGQFVPVQRNRLYILLYSTLPEQRIDIASLWKLLKGTE